MLTSHKSPDLCSFLEDEVVPLAELRRAERMGLAKHFQEATIAHNLGEEADPFVREGTMISLVGNDLPNVSRTDYPWRDKLAEWLQRGASIRYFAVNPTTNALDRLKSLRSENRSGDLAVCVPKVDSCRNDLAAKLLKLWRGFHFVVFEREPQLWVEAWHPVGITKARDCYYFGPATAPKAPLYAVCLERFDEMYSEFGERVI